MKRTDDERFQGVDFDLWKAVAEYIRHFRGRIFSLALVMIGFAIADVLPPWLMMYGIDNFATPKTLEGIEWLVGGFIAVAFFRSFLVYVMINIGGKLNQSLVYEVRRDCFNHLQDLSLSYYNIRPVGWLMSRLTSDCRTLGNTMSWGVVDIVWGVTMMVLMSGVMLYMNFRLALIVLTIAPVLLIVSYFFKKLLLAGYRMVREANSKITGAINEGIMGAQTTKTLVREAKSCENFEEMTEDMRKVSVSAASRSAAFLPIVLLIGAVGTALALYYGGKEVYLYESSGKTLGVSYGVLVAFLAYTVKFFQPIQDIANRFAELQNAQAAAERIVGLLKTEPEVKDYMDVVAPPKRFSGRIEIDNLSFHYLPSEPILKDFSLTVSPGECVAIVGETGAGKTTLTNLVARFYEPVSGTIKFDGMDYLKLPLQWIYNQLGVVLQKPHLFRGTIAENIAYGADDVSFEKIQEAAKLVYAHDFISKLQDGYDFELGEGGSGLSVGQKQLITFARAILVNPSLMVLDEATSSIDTDTEQLIQKAIEEMLKGRTSFVVAHRLSTIRNADRILVLANGGIAEMGTHHELLCHKGIYYKLYTTQFIQQEEKKLLSC